MLAPLLVAMMSVTAANDSSRDEAWLRETAADLPALGFSIGHVGILDHLDEPLIAGAEYRFARTTRWRLVPSVGISASENGAWFIYADVHYEVRLDEHWVFSPSIGVGRFGSNDEIDLGHLVEFRSGLQLAYRFDSGHRLGLALHHFSNGGISEHNPGIEELALTVSIPLSN